MAVEILYFAWVREAIGRGSETIELPDDVVTLGDLVGWLAARGESYAGALGDVSKLRGAIDQIFVSFDAPVAGAKEIALFPPVTGG